MAPSAAPPDARAQAKAQLMLRLRAKGLRDLALLRALENTPREDFVEPAFAEMALRDVALPLPCGQTMEPPSLLAHMLSLLAPRPPHRILEIGAGSGYSAGVLSLLGREVVAVECFLVLAEAARARLENLGVRNVHVLWADGLDLSPSLGTFDRILVHGALNEPPHRLIGVLRDGGVLVAPRKGEGAAQGQLFRFRRQGEQIEAEALGPVRAQNLAHGLFGGNRGK
ncbi:methyltransferase domain-containing protein [uncultured Rhodoblastus sp.]|uniref:protein-L-isoaspartate O-methyltransferase family protein n=1 Tax=uncultured Rhodoblastus sp. TaxID=543037 RepID=UPI0025F099A0|nr:methyltransferase domain-containing protein [uncultured Rhodoblastus sp.]